jgi:hypothetical protein
MVYPKDGGVQAALNYALDKEWPSVVHIEFAAVGSLREEFMTELQELLVRHPEHPFALIHMGPPQKRPAEAPREPTKIRKL